MRELKGKDDGLCEWAETVNGLVYPLDDQQWAESKRIVNRFPLFVKEYNNKNRGDTFVIALARLTGRVVVTEELPSDSLRKVLKIPAICNEYGIPWMNLLTFIREQKWSF